VADLKAGETTAMQRAEHDSIPETALAWHRDGRGAALASVVETWGSAPRPVGSLLAISGSGEIAGSVSGGCVEGAVVAEALEALADGKPRLLTYGVSDETAFAVGLACGGTIRVLVDPVGAGLPEGLLADLVAARTDRRPVALIGHTDPFKDFGKALFSITFGFVSLFARTDKYSDLLIPHGF